MTTQEAVAVLTIMRQVALTEALIWDSDALRETEPVSRAHYLNQAANVRKEHEALGLAIRALGGADHER